MGIAMQELLALEFFKDFKVIAGRKGLYKEVQGITTLEAPDCFKWSKGKELVLSSGYVIAQEPDCIRQAFKEGGIQGTSGLMIKRDRYLDKIPEEIVELCEEHDIPLISMPFAVPWMDIMRQVNIAVLNRTIRRFRIHSHENIGASGPSYKEQKIQRILQAVEGEMHFPAFLYDLEEGRGYYSSANFRQMTERFGLKEADYWEPSQACTRYTLCDYIHMYRYRLVNPGNTDGPRVSWILIPILMNGVAQAYFVVMEAREFLDYYDEYSIRIAFLLLQAVYEQLMVARNVGNIGFDNFIHFALQCGEEDRGRLAAQASVLGVSLNTDYIYAVFRQDDPQKSLRGEMDGLTVAFQKSQASRQGRFAFLDENEGVLLLKACECALKEPDCLPGLLEEFARLTAEYCGGMRLEFGFSREEKTILEIGQSIQKCRKVLKMGRLILPQDRIWDYETLGPLAWLDIPGEELEHLLDQYRALTRDEKGMELLRTLKAYLENNLNYSVTAEKMYVHINTIRKRIERVNDILQIDWKDPVSRMKTEILLQFMNL